CEIFGGEAGREYPFSPPLDVIGDGPGTGRLQEFELAIARLDHGPPGGVKGQFVLTDFLCAQNSAEAAGSLGAITDCELHPVDAL
ncbi:MAG: hypothetical protein ACE5FA_14855, partial [Dehalococcoidia bacterium]